MDAQIDSLQESTPEIKYESRKIDNRSKNKLDDDFVVVVAFVVVARITGKVIVCLFISFIFRPVFAVAQIGKHLLCLLLSFLRLCVVVVVNVRAIEVARVVVEDVEKVLFCLL